MGSGLRTRAMLLVIVAGATGAVSSPLQAQTCPNPTGTPVTITDNHFFMPGSWYANAQPTPLLGMSYEYLCHVNLGNANDGQGHLLSSEYCSLTNFQTLFQTLQSNSNHIVRISAIFNSSPGVQLGNTNSNGKHVPFNDEQVYPWIYINQAAGTYYWDLSQIDTTYLNNLESVVCSAYQHSLVVEVTLFDPWNPAWASSPFNELNAKAGQGFTAYQYFASTSDDSQQPNGTTRTYQKNGVLAIVNRLKKYPNIIWEVANEPDFIPTGTGNLPIASVMAWQSTVVQWIKSSDTSHLIMVNGHTSSSYAWNVSGAEVEAAHYTQIHSSYQGAPFEGAIDIQQGPWNQGWPLAFTENRSLPDCIAGCGPSGVDSRTVDDVRAEAWELVVGGGGLFNAYSYQMNYQSDYGDSTRDPKVASQQLLQLQKFLTAPAGWPTWGEPIDLNSALPTSCNGASDWCVGPPAWGTLDTNGSPGCASTVNAYWSTMASAQSNVLYIHHGKPLGKVFDAFHQIPCGNGSTTGYRTPLQVRVPTSGCWSIVWLDPKTGMVLSQTYLATLVGGGPPVAVPVMPYYSEDVAVVLGYVGICASGS